MQPRRSIRAWHCTRRRRRRQSCSVGRRLFGWLVSGGRAMKNNQMQACAPRLRSSMIMCAHTCVCNKFRRPNAVQATRCAAAAAAAATDACMLLMLCMCGCTVCAPRACVCALVPVRVCSSAYYVLKFWFYSGHLKIGAFVRTMRCERRTCE